MEHSVNIDSTEVILTTYGALAQGQQYRFPGETRWYHRSRNARLTEAMRNRVVETLSEDP